MSYSVGIDMGGTFTDGYFSDGRRAVAAKVPTTHFDLTRSVMACLAEGAAAFGIPLEHFLNDVGLFRLATTIGTNAVVTGTGDPIGLMVEAGAEESLYGPGEPAAAVGVFVRADQVVGVDPGAPAEVVLALCRGLVQQGVRHTVVSLRGSHRDSETGLRELVRDRYPVHYLRSMPLTMGWEAARIDDDELRTSTAVLNAYLSRSMAKLLYRTEGVLQQAGLPVPLLAARSDGTFSRMPRTTAISTYSSGPAAGLGLAAAEARRHGDAAVVGFDMGGTTLDLGLVRDGVYQVVAEPEIRGVRVSLPVPGIVSVGLGGSSVAAVGAPADATVGPAGAGALTVGPGGAGAETEQPGGAGALTVDPAGAGAETRRPGGAGALTVGPAGAGAETRRPGGAGALTVGPASVGAVPGPAAFGRGGTEPTLTDADVVLGLLADGQELPGGIVLDADRAAAALAPLAGGDDVAAARLVHAAAHAKAAAAVSEVLAGAAIDPTGATLYAFGGAGGLHAAEVAALAGIGRVRSFAAGGMFSARGVAEANVEQRYQAAVEAAEDFAGVLRRLLARARLDLEAERLASGETRTSVAVRTESGGSRSCDVSLARGPDLAVADALAALDDTGSVVAIEVTSTLGGPAAAASTLEEPAASAPTPVSRDEPGRRDVRWSRDPVATPVVGLAEVPEAASIDGPVLVDCVGAVHAVPPGWTVRRQDAGSLLWERSR